MSNARNGKIIFPANMRRLGFASGLVVAALLLLVLSLILLNVKASGDDWSMFHHDLQRSGYSTFTAPSTNNKLWDYTTGGQIISSPALVDGKLYIGSRDNKTYCLDAFTGASIWNFTTGFYIESSPAVAYGNVYVGSGDMRVYCLNASTGASIWNFTTGDPIASSPAIAEDKLYVGSEDGLLYCLNASTGTSLWNYTTGGLIDSSPAVAYGNVYVGSDDQKVYCFGLADTTPPGITDVSQTPSADNVSLQDTVHVNATVTDKASGVKEVTLSYASNNGTWTNVTMSNLVENVWSASIPAFPYGTNVTYIIKAQDNAGNAITTLGTAYEHQYVVIPEFPTPTMALLLFIISTLLAIVFHRRQPRSASPEQEQAAEPRR